MLSILSPYTPVNCPKINGDLYLEFLVLAGMKLTPMKQTCEFLSQIVLFGLRSDGGHSARRPSQ